MAMSYDDCLYPNDPETCEDPLQDQQSGSEDKYGGEVNEAVWAAKSQMQVTK